MLTAVLGLVIAACSSSAGTSTAGSSASAGSGAGVTSGSTSAGVQAAEAELKVAEARPASIGLPAFSKAIPPGKTVSFVHVNLPTFVILQPVMEGFDSYYKQWCPNCKLSTMSVPLTSIGTTAPSLIVSYLRAHPDINRIAVGYDGVDVGLPAALASAGLSGKVKFIGEAPTATNLAYVQAGTEAATVAQGYYEIWGMYLDAAARALTGQSLAPDNAWKVPWFLVTQSNYSQGTGYAPIVPNLDSQLKQLWKK